MVVLNKDTDIQAIQESFDALWSDALWSSFQFRPNVIFILGLPWRGSQRGRIRVWVSFHEWTTNRELFKNAFIVYHNKSSDLVLIECRKFRRRKSDCRWYGRRRR